MKYVIYFPASDAYYRQDEKGIKTLVCDVKRASKFSNKSYAEKEIKVRLDKGDASFKEANICSYNNGDLNSIQESKPEKKEIDFTNIETSADELFNAVNIFSQNMKNIDVASLKDFYTAKLSEYDKAQQDILHKIENEEMVGMRAISLMRQLKEIRKKRREVKDRFAFANILEQTNATAVANAIGKYNDNLETRTYHPRVLKELFK
jgi:hypothetical protein